MCGIAGFVTSAPRMDSSTVLAEMARVVAHRGPDDEGFFQAATKRGSHKVGLAHRRLSIIDLATGHQPLGNKDGTVQIVFNGEIYNFPELRSDLEKRGHRFATRSDTEVIVYAYEEWGEACVERLRGMFAFALWDARRERLLLARDRFGEKPLFLHDVPGGVVFASEIKSILAYPGVRASVDHGALWDYFAYRYAPGPSTLFAGVRKLPPGCYALWERGVLRETPYYSLPDRDPLPVAPVPQDPVGAFLDKLDESVRIRMISDVPFGAFLSGGVDSSAVVALMARHSSQPVKTFSVGFAESAFSELKYAKTVAEHLQTEHHEVTVSYEDLMVHLPALVRFRDAPVAEPADIPIYVLSKEARSTVKMVLTGEGSDEILAGYPKHFFEPYVPLYQRCPAALRRGVFEPIVRALPYGFHRAKTAIVNLGLERFEERMPRWFGALSDREREDLIDLPIAVHQDRYIQFDTPKCNSVLRRILYFDQMSWLPDNLLERGDRMSMAASLEVRIPFVDHELAALVSSLPDRYRVRGATNKWLLREAMKRLLPGAILQRPHVGFRMPVDEWFRGPMREYLYDHLASADSRTRSYYRRPALERKLADHVEGRQNHGKLLWSLLNLEIWHREYGVT